ncbi:MAG: hypothetical protein Mars2KO_19570 [Maribacter sp.]
MFARFGQDGLPIIAIAPYHDGGELSELLVQVLLEYDLVESGTVFIRVSGTDQKGRDLSWLEHPLAPA